MFFFVVLFLAEKKILQSPKLCEEGLSGGTWGARAGRCEFSRRKALAPSYVKKGLKDKTLADRFVGKHFLYNFRV